MFTMLIVALTTVALWGLYMQVGVPNVALTYRNDVSCFSSMVKSTSFLEFRLKISLNKVEHENFFGLLPSFKGTVKELIFVAKHV